MTRWFNGSRGDRSGSGMVSTPKVDAFMDELEAVCVKHGFSIGHEDTHGGFIVSRFSSRTMKWLRAAALDDSVGEKDR